uniref:Uncharacterized protein n=1 Tax=Arundo donax TaxID=35708 RepID=A0A0A8ZCV2_ARUDO
MHFQRLGILFHSRLPISGSLYFNTPPSCLTDGWTPPVICLISPFPLSSLLGFCSFSTES